jgi:hypothetical protein
MSDQDIPSDDSSVVGLRKHRGARESRQPATEAGTPASTPTRVPQAPVIHSNSFTFGPEDYLPALLTQTLIIRESKTAEGVLIASIALPSPVYQIDPWKWEEIIAASYQESGLFDEVILTPRSNDGAKDVIAIRKGYGAIRFVESVKRYKLGNVVTADEVRAMVGLLYDPKNSKGVVSTTSTFAPKIDEDPLIRQFMPYRLDLVDGAKLIERFKLWADPDQRKV